MMLFKSQIEHKKSFRKVIVCFMTNVVLPHPPYFLFETFVGKI